MPGFGLGFSPNFGQVNPSGGGGNTPPPPPMRESFAILFSSDTADVITDGRGNAIEFRRIT